MAEKIKKLRPEDALVLGIDPSLNGTAFVFMKNFKVVDYYFFTTVVKMAKSAGVHAILNKATDISRLSSIYDVYNKLLEKYKLQVNYSAIENYAFGAASGSAFQIGGCGELLRLLTYRENIPYKEYAPTKVKKFATGDGGAQKSQMVLAAFKDGFDVGQYGKSGEDLADAYWIAKMVTSELFIRRDITYLSKLTKQQQEAFLETNKKYPTPLIERPFVGGN